MAAKTNYLENKYLDHTFGGSAFTQPTAWYLALHTADAGEDATSSVVTGGSYARKQVTSWTGTGDERANGNVVEFPDMPGVTVTHASIWDAVTGGNPLYHGALSAPKTVTAGETLRVPVGDFKVKEA
jgi:hypothetical protein